MTNKIMYKGNIRKRATDTSMLKTRLLLNEKYQSKDFNQWLQSRLDIKPAEFVLDVGCGTGAQTIPFLKAVGVNGRVDALDISRVSVNFLKKLTSGNKRLRLAVGDMKNLKKIIKRSFREEKYNLAHSAYSLYYCSDRGEVLKEMVSHLHPSGRLAIFTPFKPHGMVEIARKFSLIPKQVDECFNFGPEVLEPFFRKTFWEIEIHYFQSEVKMNTDVPFLKFYKSTTYYDHKAFPKIKTYVNQQINSHGFISFEKNGYLIIGKDKKTCVK